MKQNKVNQSQSKRSFRLIEQTMDNVSAKMKVDVSFAEDLKPIGLAETYSHSPTPPACGQTGFPNFAAIRSTERISTVARLVSLEGQIMVRRNQLTVYAS